MNVAKRTRLYVQARLGINGLNRRTASLANQPRELVRQTFQYCSGYLEPVQVEDEIVELVDEVRKLRPRTVVEIGTSMGGTLYLWTRVAEPDAVLVSIDLPHGKFGGGYSPLRTPLYRRFARERQKLHLLRCDSHSPATVAQIRELLQGQAIDFLFIDGDHTYEGVRQDWESYSALVRPGGLIAFHDVAMNYDDTQVKRFWDEIKSDLRHREYLSHPRGFYGIGLVFK